MEELKMMKIVKLNQEELGSVSGGYNGRNFREMTPENWSDLALVGYCFLVSLGVMALIFEISPSPDFTKGLID